MMFFLKGKNKLSFVKESMPLPIDPDVASKWNRVNSVVMSWIFNSVDKSLYSNFVFYNKASDVWFDLRQTYCKIHETRLYGLLQEISKISQDSDSVSIYYMKIKHLWDEYSALKSQSKCVCNVAIVLEMKKKLFI